MWQLLFSDNYKTISFKWSENEEKKRNGRKKIQAKKVNYWPHAIISLCPGVSNILVYKLIGRIRILRWVNIGS